jgi:5'-3' exonuclease
LRGNGNLFYIADTYNNVIGKYNDRSLIDPITKNIAWNHVQIFISSLAEKEDYYIKKETADRERWDNRKWRTHTKEDIDELILNVPMIYRMDEKYICPTELGWEDRYYKRVHGIKRRNEKQEICKRYMEGIEWVYKYYRSGCESWEWRYGYSGSPLLKDIECKKIKVKDKSKAKSSEEQLEYVMPKGEREMSWEYKRYNWESKIKNE